MLATGLRGGYLVFAAWWCSIGGKGGVGGEQLGMTSMAGEGFRLRISFSQEKAVMGSAHPGTEGEGVCME